MSLFLQKHVLDLVKNVVENFIRDSVIPDAEIDIPELNDKSCGVFVTIKQGKELRGCIGTIIESSGCIKDDIVKNAIAAATSDPRFPPVAIDELDNLSYSVDILKKPFKTDDISTLDPKKYGIIVRKNFRQGVLLPDIEGVETVSNQLRIACIKAGIAPDENPDIYAFEVIRFGEK